MKKPRVFILIAAAAFLMVAGAIVFWPSFGAHELWPTCHKQVLLAMNMTIQDSVNGSDGHSGTNAYPNVAGISSNSMQVLGDVSRDLCRELQTRYQYVPGLREDDPADLVLMYLKRPTRCIWHGDFPTFFRPRKWVVVRPDFGLRSMEEPSVGELSDWIDRPEFERRLRKTLDFLKANNRPYWTNVVAEHEAFLKAIK